MHKKDTDFFGESSAIKAAEIIAEPFHIIAERLEKLQKKTIVREDILEIRRLALLLEDLHFFIGKR